MPGLKPPAGEDAVLNLLSVEFTPTDEPAGTVTLYFSGGGALRLDVECLECELTDLGADDLGTSAAGIAPSEV